MLTAIVIAVITKFSKLIVVYFYPRVNSSDTATVSLFDTIGTIVRLIVYEEGMGIRIECGAGGEG